MKIALCLIVKGDDKEAQYLYKCLQNVSPHVDDIFITSTFKKGEEHNKKVDEVANMFSANKSYFEWCNDFSKARNFNFSQVPKEYDYILWCDADDNFRGLEKLRDTIEKHPADNYILYYLYSFDEWKNPNVVHPKSQIIKNDGCVKWVGALHEDFEPTRELISYFIKDIERIHLSDNEHFEANKQRNIEVSKQQIEDDPKDPRSYWNYANSLKGAGKDNEAIEMFNKFLELSKSDEEKYIVRLRLAESYWILDKKEKALDEVRYAIGYRPEYPDAYHLAGNLYFELKQFEKARDMYLTGLLKKPPYYSIIVYNPRDYDYIPMMNLAKTYFAMNLPQMALPLLEGCLKIYPKDRKINDLVKKMKKEADKADRILKYIEKIRKIENKEKLKKELDKIPQEFQSHPALCNIRNIHFIKETSSGRDVVFFCGFTEEEWTPETAKMKGIGGSEEAIIWLSKLLVKRGWNVEVYNNCGHKEQIFDGVKYKPYWSWNYRDKQDIVVLWRSPKLAEYNINTTKLFIDLHDVIKEGEFTEKRLAKIDKIFVKSNFHRSLFPNVPDEKFVVIPNGIDCKLFEKEIKKNDNLIINTSSPDRSLSTFIDICAEIKKQIPDVICKWAYGWGVFDVAHGEDMEIMKWKEQQIDKMKEMGIENLGRLSHDEIAKLYKKANIFLYPSEFAEIDCISLTKAMAGGAIPLTTDFSAMGEKENPYGLFVNSEKTKDNWCLPYQYDFALQDEKKKRDLISEAIKILKNPPKDRSKLKEQAKKYDWNLIVKQWEQEWK